MADLPDPQPGEVIFHARCLPALTAGDYLLRVGQQVSQGGQRLDQGAAKPLPGQRVYPITVDAPRFTLDPSLIHAVFPPTNGVGSYVTRLPMIVLRRRTLPWERRLGAGTDAPWLAVLLFEEGEATTLSPCTVREVLDGSPNPDSPRLNLPDVPAAVLDQPCLGLEMTLDLFKDIAPMASEVPLLTHVRQVNTDDKELMGMDDDGWFAVVMGNRIPEPGLPSKPKKYQACLVSLEGAQAFLPTEAECEPLTDIDISRPLFFDFEQRASLFAKQIASSDPEVDTEAISNAILAKMMEAGSAHSWIATADDAGVVSAAQGKTKTSVHGSSQPARDGAWTNLVIDKANKGLDGSRDFAGKSLAVKLLTPKVRLFMLAQWSFECRDGGDFEAIMQALPRNGGVAMLGMPPSIAQAQGGVGAAVWRAALDTGHVPLPHLTRDGEQTIAWYRGPLTPVGVARDPAGPYHCADQARRLDPATGLENLGYAAAFEIGRLLALGDPRFALDLLHWRRDGRLALDSALVTRLIRSRLPVNPLVALPQVFDPRAMQWMPRILSSITTQSIDGLMRGGRFGAMRDPTGLAALRARLPGLDAGVLAEAKGFQIQVAQSLLGSVALGGSVLDTIGFAEVVPAETRLEVLALDPSLHFGAQQIAFDLRLEQTFIKGL